MILLDDGVPRGYAGACWELRFTERALTACIEHPDVVERVLATVSALDAERPLDEQTSPGARLGEGDSELTLSRDADGTYWITGIGHEVPAGAPSASDRWRRHRDRLGDAIADIRVVMPLLNLRVTESGVPCRVELGEFCVGLARSEDAVELNLLPPAWCSDSEAGRLAAVAAACVSATPGWRLERNDDDRRLSVVLGARHAGTHAT